MFLKEQGPWDFLLKYVHICKEQILNDDLYLPLVYLWCVFSFVQVNLPVNMLPVTFSGHGHGQALNAPDDLPKNVTRTLNQGSSPMSMDFHPAQQTLLLGLCFLSSLFFSFVDLHALHLCLVIGLSLSCLLFILAIDCWLFSICCFSWYQCGGHRAVGSWI